jgi:hypothetical protein
MWSRGLTYLPPYLLFILKQTPLPQCVDLIIVFIGEQLAKLYKIRAEAPVHSRLLLLRV